MFIKADTKIREIKLNKSSEGREKGVRVYV
jgi:hypothetical protein